MYLFVTLNFTGRMSFKSRHLWIVTPVKLRPRSSATEGKQKHAQSSQDYFYHQQGLLLHSVLTLKFNFAICQPPH